MVKKMNVCKNCLNSHYYNDATLHAIVALQTNSMPTIENTSKWNRK